MIFRGMYAYQGGLYRSKSLIVGGKEVSGIWRIDAENIEKEAELVLPITDQWQLNSVNVVRGYSQLSYYDGMLLLQYAAGCMEMEFRS